MNLNQVVRSHLKKRFEHRESVPVFFRTKAEGVQMTSAFKDDEIYFSQMDTANLTIHEDHLEFLYPSLTYNDFFDGEKLAVKVDSEKWIVPFSAIARIGHMDTNSLNHLSLENFKCLERLELKLKSLVSIPTDADYKTIRKLISDFDFRLGQTYHNASALMHSTNSVISYADTWVGIAENYKNKAFSYEETTLDDGEHCLRVSSPTADTFLIGFDKIDFDMTAPKQNVSFFDTEMQGIDLPSSPF